MRRQEGGWAHRGRFRSRKGVPKNRPSVGLSLEPAEEEASLRPCTHEGHEPGSQGRWDPDGYLRFRRDFIFPPGVHVHETLGPEHAKPVEDLLVGHLVQGLEDAGNGPPPSLEGPAHASVHHRRRETWDSRAFGEGHPWRDPENRQGALRLLPQPLEAGAQAIREGQEPIDSPARQGLQSPQDEILQDTRRLQDEARGLPAILWFPDPVTLLPKQGLLDGPTGQVLGGWGSPPPQASEGLSQLEDGFSLERPPRGLELGPCQSVSVPSQNGTPKQHVCVI